MLTRLVPVGAAAGAIAGFAAIPIVTAFLGTLVGVAASLGLLVWRWMR